MTRRWTDLVALVALVALNLRWRWIEWRDRRKARVQYIDRSRWHV